MTGSKAKTKADNPLTVLTVGHSTRAIQDFIYLLQVHGVTRVVDVRTIPRSRHNPQFNAEALPASLREVGIGYTHLAKLGGLRHSNRNSQNLGWRNASFRGYADYMQTPDFESGLAELIRSARNERVAVMCAEAVPWACHRSLIADALLVRGIHVEHIMSRTHSQAHRLIPFAKVQGTTITYPAVGKEELDTEFSRSQHPMTTDSGKQSTSLKRARPKRSPPRTEPTRKRGICNSG
jgi:hypothetical protein